MYWTLAFSGRSKNSAPFILGTLKTIKYASNTFSNNTRCLAAYKKVNLVLVAEKSQIYQNNSL